MNITMQLHFAGYAAASQNEHIIPENIFRSYYIMEFFTTSVEVLQTLVVALGAGLGVWGIVNLLEGYGNDNPGAKSQGVKQFVAGGAVAAVGMLIVPQLATLFTV